MSPDSSGLISTLLFLALFGAVFYFFLIRPERRRRQQHRALIESLKRGDKVVTIGGIVGIIKKVDKDHIWVEVEDGVTLKLVKDSVAEKEKVS
jgi:preprotein translocase subunit YajC